MCIHCLFEAHGAVCRVLESAYPDSMATVSMVISIIPVQAGAAAATIPVDCLSVAVVHCVFVCVCVQFLWCGWLSLVVQRAHTHTHTHTHIHTHTLHV